MQVDVNQLVTNEVAMTMDIPASSLNADTPLAELGLDSLQALQLLVSLEEALQIRFDEEDVKQFKTIQAIVDLVNERCRKAAAA
jgi:acyl carrier protein